MSCVKNLEQLIIKEKNNFNECSECAYDDRPFGYNRVNRGPCTCTRNVTTEFFCEEHETFVNKCQDCDNYYHYYDYWNSGNPRCFPCYRNHDPSDASYIYEWMGTKWSIFLRKITCDMCSIEYFYRFMKNIWRPRFVCHTCIKNKDDNDYEIRVDNSGEELNLLVVCGTQIYIEESLVQEFKSENIYPYVRKKCCGCKSTWSSWISIFDYSQLNDYRCVNCNPSTELLRFRFEKGPIEKWVLDKRAFKCKICNSICWFGWLEKDRPQIERCSECEPTNPDLKFEKKNSGWMIKKKKTTNGSRHYWTSMGCDLLTEDYKCDCKKCEKSNN
jgi:hypothetical protein